MVKSAKSRILTALSNGRTLTVKQAQSRFGISNVSARVSQLRQEGYSIYTNKTATGFAYRLGRPSVAFIAQCNIAGVIAKGPEYVA